MLGVFLIYYSYTKFTPAQFDNLKELFRTADYSYVILAMALGLISDFFRAYRWNYLLIPIGHKVKLKNSIMAVGAAYMLNLLIPRGGEVTRAVIVNKYDNVPVNHALGTIIAERAVDFLVLLALIFVTLLLQFNLLQEYLESYISFEKFIYLGLVLLFVLAAGFLFFRSSQNKFVLKIKKFIEGIIEGCLSILKSKKKGKFFIITLLIWGLYLLTFYVIIFALPETSSISFSSVITAFVVGSLTIAFTNGGFGTFPFIIAEILFLFGVDIAAGTALGWLAWLSQTLLVIIYGSVSLLLLPVLNQRK